MTEKLLTADEVADMLAVPVGWIREHTRSGALPCLVLGRYRRYDRAEVLAWLEHCRSGGGPAFRRHRPKVAAKGAEA